MAECGGFTSDSSFGKMHNSKSSNSINEIPLIYSDPDPSDFPQTLPVLPLPS